MFLAHATMKTLDKFLRQDQYKSVLELGSGRASTPRICQHLEGREGAYFLSLEDSQVWYNKVTPLIEKYDFVDYELSPLCTRKRGVWYSHKFTRKFDLIFIDGPGKMRSKPKGIQRRIKQVQKSSRCPIRPRVKAGSQSLGLMDYVLPACKNGTVIVVDCRIASGLHYLQCYRKFFKFEWRGKKVPQQRLSGIVKKGRKFQPLLTYPIREVTIIHVRKLHKLGVDS